MNIPISMIHPPRWLPGAGKRIGVNAGLLENRPPPQERTSDPTTVDDNPNRSNGSPFRPIQYARRWSDFRINVPPMANMPVSPMPQENPANNTGAYCRHMAP